MHRCGAVFVQDGLSREDSNEHTVLDKLVIMFSLQGACMLDLPRSPETRNHQCIRWLTGTAQASDHQEGIDCCWFVSRIR